MKKLNYVFYFLITVLFYSCSEEELQLDNEILIIENKSLQKTAPPTKCNVEDSCGSSGNTITLSYNSNFSTNDVNWSIQSGNISIIAGQGTSEVTLLLGSGFTGGSVLAIGSGDGGIIVCSTISTVTRCCTPPTSILLDQTSGKCFGDVFTFQANLNGSTDNGSYQWSSFQGSSIISGQGTSTVRIQSPSSGGFSVSVNHINSCENKSIRGFNLAQFDSGCDSGGGWGF